MTIQSPATIDASYIQDGQPAGSITPATVRLITDSLAGQFASVQSGAAYSLVLTDRGTTIEFNSAAAVTVTIPLNATVTFDLNVVIALCQVGAGQVTVVGVTGVTVVQPPSNSPATRAQYAVIYLRQRAANIWVVWGDMASVAVSAGPGPAVSGTFVNVDFTNNLNTQTVSQYVWGVSTSSMGVTNFASCADTTLLAALQTLAFPLYRFGAQAGYTENAFPGGATTSTNLATVFAPLVNNAPHFLPANGRLIVSLGYQPNNWSSAANFASVCSQIASYLNTANSPVTGRPIGVWGFEVGNTGDAGSGVAPSYYNSYFNAASVAIKAVNSSFKVLGPAFSYVSGVSAFTTGCAGNYDVIDYHYYQYGGQTNFTSQGGVAGVLNNNSYAAQPQIAAAISGTTPILLSEYNQNNAFGTLSAGLSPGVCNTYMSNYVGAVFNAQVVLEGLNATNNFQMAAIFDVFASSDYGLIGATDVPGGGTYGVSPGAYFLSKAAATLYGTRANVAIGSGAPVLNTLAVSNGPGSTNFAVMLINYSQSVAYTGQLALSHWPVNGTGNGTANVWTLSSTNPNGIVTTVSVTAGLTASITVPAPGIAIIYV